MVVEWEEKSFSKICHFLGGLYNGSEALSAQMGLCKLGSDGIPSSIQLQIGLTWV